ncbi:transcriptional activator NhaR [Teredinibacter purpureus]|uniref:transcriptional activator NhaR n=1 Tax=Teredinibacter purpureus TaxID=2731756 RepID=UPI0005F78A62|nr:transcriptional activator NhaR [Teredinibacter purpureus]
MAQQLNYNHLRYFYTIAKEGSIVNAAKLLHLSPQTISGQLTVFEEYLGLKLFDRRGKRLIMNDAGKLVYSYAEDIFTLGLELQQSLDMNNPEQNVVFTVGIVDVIPKILAFNILEKCFELEESIKLISREGDYDGLLADLALNKIDLIISDRPLTPGVAVKAYNHYLGECGVSFYATEAIAPSLKKNFPKSLDQCNFLICGDKSNQKINLQSWFDTENINPIIVAEFDDSALMKFFGQSGYGVFATPTTIEPHVIGQYDVIVIGRTNSISERFYAISPERKIKHPAVKALVDAAKSILL